MKRYDLISVTRAGKSVLAIVAAGGQNPDSHVYAMSIDGLVSLHFPDACRVQGVLVNGKQFLDHDQAAMRTELEALARSKYGRAQLANARTSPQVVIRQGRSKRRETVVMPTPGRGRLPDYQPPMETTGNPLDRFISVGDPGSYVDEITRDDRTIRALDKLKTTNPRWHRVAVLSIHEGRKPADIAALLGITANNARVTLHKALTALDDYREEVTA